MLRSLQSQQNPLVLNQQQQQQHEKSKDELLKRYRVEFTPDEAIHHLVAGFNKVIIATKDKKILIIDTKSNKQTHCDIAKYLSNRWLQAKIYKMFLDPSGKFLLLSLVFSADNQPMENLLYVKQIQPLPRLKNHLISAVGWNTRANWSSQTANCNTTGTILIGTTKGLVLQVEFTCNDETKFFPLSGGPRQYVKEVFDVGPEGGAITSIEYYQVTNNNSTVEKSYVILLSTSCRLYRMIGNVPANVEPPPLHTIFAQCANNFKEVPKRFMNSKLDVCYPANLANYSNPLRFAWLTDVGIMTSELYEQYSALNSSFDSNSDMNLIPYNNPEDFTMPLSPNTPSGMSSPPISSSNPMVYYDNRPVSIVATQFHVIVLFRHCIKAICILNNLTVYEELFAQNYGKVLGMSKDPIRNIVWVFCKRVIFRYKMINENKNIWKIYLDQKQFDLAKKYSSDDKYNYDRVISEEASHFFKLKEYEKSAEIYARSKKPFEDVSLMFMNVKSTKALQKYLMIKLDDYDDLSTPLQLSMILAWLFEIIISSISVVLTLNQTDRNKEELEELYAQLDDLLALEHAVGCIKYNKQLFFGIISNYSSSDIFARIARLIEDYDQLMKFYMEQGDFENAIETLKAAKNTELFYQYGHILVKRVPKEFVDALIEQRHIDANKLIPILIQENPYYKKCSETIRYLEHCVKTLNTDCKVMHNYLFELYARYRSETTLMEFLEGEIPDDIETPQVAGTQHKLDLQFCLRLCTELKLVKTCVVLYSHMGLYDEAVNLALDLDVELAKSIAKKVDSEDHQKKLWLSIAESVLTKNTDIEIATNLLNECRLLRIEDILPFFPDYKTIDFFKDAIRKSLQEYRNQIMLLKDGTYDTIADEIRSEIKLFKSRYSIIKTGQKCEICWCNIMLRSFYVFPCGHLFHSDCIVREIMSIDSQYKSIEDKLRQLAVFGSSGRFTSSYGTKQQQQLQQQQFATNSVPLQNSLPKSAATIGNIGLAGGSKEKILHELDQIASSECIFCGSLLASYINKTAPISSDPLNPDAGMI